MTPDPLLHHRQAVLTAATVPHARVITPAEIDLGELSRVITACAHTDAVLYGEFTVETAVLDDHDPSELQFDEHALCGVVEDWGQPQEDTVTLSAYVYFEAHDHGPLGMTLEQAIRTLNHIRTRCLHWLDPANHHPTTV